MSDIIQALIISKTHRYLLDFDKMIYDKTVTFRFHRFLREEQKFAGMQELKEQLLKDCDRARNYFRQRKEG